MPERTAIAGASGAGDAGGGWNVLSAESEGEARERGGGTRVTRN